jgi:LEA14-like dessication related protein
MHKRFFPTLVLVLASLAFLSGCQKPKDLVFKDFKNLAVDKLSFAGAKLKVDLIYYNPNNFSLQLNRTDLDIFVDSTFLGHSSQNVQITVPKRNDFTLPLTVDLDVKNLLKNGMTGLSSYFNKDVKIRFLGSVKLGKAGVYKSFKVDYTTVQNLSKLK